MAKRGRKKGGSGGGCGWTFQILTCLICVAICLVLWQWQQLMLPGRSERREDAPKRVVNAGAVEQRWEKPRTSVPKVTPSRTTTALAQSRTASTTMPAKSRPKPSELADWVKDAQRTLAGSGALLASVAVVSHPSSAKLRASLRQSWLQWFGEPRVKTSVHWGFHIAVCHTDLTLEQEAAKFGDIVIHKQEVGDICGDKRIAGLMAMNQSAQALPAANFVTVVDDGGFLCVPNYIDTLAQLPIAATMWGKAMCSSHEKQHMGEDFITVSLDMARALNAISETIVYESLEEEEMTLGRFLTHALKDWSHQQFTINIFDDRDRVDSPEGWLLTHMQMKEIPEHVPAFGNAAKRFFNAVCKRIVWSSAVSNAEIRTLAYRTAREERHEAKRTKPHLVHGLGGVCHGPKEAVHRWTSETAFDECKEALGAKRNARWAEELCSHRYIFVRGQHHTGTTVVTELIASGLDSTVSSFERQADFLPKVNQYEGQFLQDLFPWDNPPLLKSCFCGCPSEDDWVCNYMCPLRDDSWGRRKMRARKLFERWKLFWDMRKAVLLEKTPEMGSEYLLAMFPKVSTIVYIMRHPFTARQNYLHAACRGLETIGACIDDWLRMWQSVPRESVVVIRLENALLDPDQVSPQLQERLQLVRGTHLRGATGGRQLQQSRKTGLCQQLHGQRLRRRCLRKLRRRRTAHRKATPRRLELRKGKVSRDMLWEATKEKDRTTKAESVAVATLAKKCIVNAKCKAQLQERQAMIARFGYNLTHPPSSILGNGKPFVELSEIFQDLPVQQVGASCEGRFRSGCDTVRNWLKDFDSDCDE